MSTETPAYVAQMTENLGEEPVEVDLHNIVNQDFWEAYDTTYLYPQNDVVVVGIYANDNADAQKAARKFFKNLNKAAAKKYAATTFHFCEFKPSRRTRDVTPVVTTLAQIASEDKERKAAKAAASASTIAKGSSGAEFNAALENYTGSTRKELAESVLPNISEALARGYWTSKADARHARAVLGKTTGAAGKALKAARDIADELRFRRYNATNRSEEEALQEVYDLWADLSYMPTTATEVEDKLEALRSLRATKPSREQLDIVETLESFYKGLLPVFNALEKLDSAAPPVKVYKVNVGDLSPTVKRNLTSHNLDPATVRFPPIEQFQKTIQKKDKDGVLREKIVSVIRILWPENTVHNVAHMRKGSGLYHQCDACAHAIKNPFNWVPLLVDNKNGIPYSMWVGQDCASNLFGYKLDGDAVFDASSTIRPGVASVDVGSSSEAVSPVAVEEPIKPKSKVVELADFIDWEEV